MTGQKPAPPAKEVGACRECGHQRPETLMFVDVDGVLNVGVHIKGEAPINLTEANLQRALTLRGHRNLHADRILAAIQRRLGHGEGSTYAKFTAHSSSDVSEVLVARLAEVIREAGEGCTVVLSSSWRKPQHKQRARKLEGRIAAHLGKPFAFHDCTPVCSESSAEDRLSCIGQYLTELAKTREEQTGQLRVLVLEDFCISPLRRIKCKQPPALHGPERQNEAFAVENAEDAERYLGACAAGMAKDVQVKVVHTYDSWTSPDGLFMQVGSGLTMGSLCAALAFLGGPCDFCVQADHENYAQCTEIYDLIDQALVDDGESSPKGSFGASPCWGARWLISCR